ncbi:MAG: hypothetical protein P4L22_00725 [Candidatus Babeliales bacterium]|nr:hypothetical protein [Candidatus Babeliales bacterium]
MNIRQMLLATLLISSVSLVKAGVFDSAAVFKTQPNAFTSIANVINNQMMPNVKPPLGSSFTVNAGTFGIQDPVPGTVKNLVITLAIPEGTTVTLPANSSIVQSTYGCITRGPGITCNDYPQVAKKPMNR